MRTFDYHAIDARGERVKGQLEARDRSAAIRRLRASGLIPTKLSATRPGGGAEDEDEDAEPSPAQLAAAAEAFAAGLARMADEAFDRGRSEAEREPLQRQLVEGLTVLGRLSRARGEAMAARLLGEARGAPWPLRSALHGVVVALAPDAAGAARALEALARAGATAGDAVTARLARGARSYLARAEHDVSLEDALLGLVPALRLREEAERLGNEALAGALVAGLTVPAGTLERALPGAGGQFVERVYREVYAPEVGRVMREVLSTIDERGLEALAAARIDGPDDPEATGLQAALLRLATGPLPLVNVRVGGMHYPGWLLLEGRLCWLGKLNPLLVGSDELFRLGCAGHAAGFDPGDRTGQEVVTAWIEHIRQRAAAAEAP